MIKVGTVLFCVMVSSMAYAHGGRTNAEGCHRDSRANEVHCHNSGSSASQLTQSESLSDSKYERKAFMSRWRDQDGDCQDARQEVLIEESLTPPTMSDDGCRVVSGQWYDPYTDAIYDDPSDLDIDHYVPLEEAYESGASAWDKAKKNAYANDLNNPNTLIAVSLSANRSKGARDPSEWMPPNAEYHCDYLVTWVQVKEHFNMSMDAKEFNFINQKIQEC